MTDLKSVSRKWRAEKGELYYRLQLNSLGVLFIEQQIERHSTTDTRNHELHNYFRTEDKAVKYLCRIKLMLKNRT